jgi:hypothetical protein
MGFPARPVRRAIKDLLEKRANQVPRESRGLQAETASKALPVRRVSKAQMESRALRGRKDRRASRVHRASPGPAGPPGPAGSTALHVVSQQSCEGDKKCELACNAGEKLASVTCPGGNIAISKSNDVETASCTNSSGPALALCMRP